jgi:uncharacterized protein
MATAEPSFELRSEPEAEPGDTLLVGTANLGLAGLTALDYLVSHSHTERIGHVHTRKLPDITPFTEGEPRRPMRLYTAPDSRITVLLSEVFVPVGAGEPFADAVATWAGEHGIAEVGVLHGVPFPHGPDEHVVFHVSTPGFRERRLDDTVEPLSGGFFDGLVGELLVRGLDGAAPPTGVLVTPTHPPGPDFDGAFRFLDALERLYGLAVDETELRTRSEETRRYFQELADRMRAVEEAEGAGRRDRPEDRMYM